MSRQMITPKLPTLSLDGIYNTKIQLTCTPTTNLIPPKLSPSQASSLGDIDLSSYAILAVAERRDILHRERKIVTPISEIYSKLTTVIPLPLSEPTIPPSSPNPTVNLDSKTKAKIERVDKIFSETAEPPSTHTALPSKPTKTIRILITEEGKDATTLMEWVIVDTASAEQAH